MKKRELFAAAIALSAAALIGKKADAATPGSVLAIISHDVKDYAAWRAFFDGPDRVKVRTSAGITDVQILQQPGKPNSVIVIQQFSSVDLATAFLANPNLKAAMEKAGVLGTPNMLVGVSA